jgi:DNA-binding NarL/FixJ family response regulator
VPCHRILIVEDFEGFRRFISSTLNQKAGFEVIGEALDGLEALQKVQELQPDLILLDIGLPNLDGIEVARRIRNVAPGAKILFVSQESAADVVLEAFSMGAQGYVHKVCAQRDLLRAVETVLAGERFVSSGLVSQHPTKR